MSRRFRFNTDGIPTRWVRAGLLGSLCCLVLARATYVTFDPAREKLVQTSIAPAAGVVAVRTTEERLQPPFALIARIHNASVNAQSFSIRADGRTVCEPTVRGGAIERVDCVVLHRNEGGHELMVAASTLPWTVEYLEIATHHGYTTGVMTAFVLPRDSTAYAPPGPAAWALIGMLLVALFWLPPAPLPARPVSIGFSILTTLVVGVFTAILFAPIVSRYRIVLSTWTLLAWACLLRALVAASLAWYPTRLWNICRLHHRALAALLSLAICLATVIYGSRALGASDTYGYVSEADLWLRGNLRIDQSFGRETPWPQPAWTFSPFAYRPDPRDDRWLVPVCSPGLPLLLAIAKKIAGQTAMFVVVPLCAGLLVLATYGLGRRLGHDVVGLAGAWLVATSPVVLGHSMSAMNDVPVAAAWAGAAYFLLGRGPGSALVAGLLSSVAILIRPNLVPLAAVLSLYYVFKLWSPATRREALVRVAWFAVSAAPGAVGVAVINQYLFGSPLFSGYGQLGDLFELSRVPTNVRRYVGWLIDAHTPLVLAGLVAILLPFRRLWPQTRDRSLFIVIGIFVATVWVIYCAWVVFDTWWFSRFLLPTFPFMMLGVAAAAAALFRLESPWIRRTVVVVLAAMGVIQVRFADARAVFEIGRLEHRNVVVAQLHRQIADPNSVTLAILHVGSLRYYGGRMTLNWAYLEQQWLDRAVDWLREQGIHTYLVAEDWELPEFRQHFAETRGLAALEAPIAMYLDPGKLMIFDLTARPSPAARPVVVRGTSHIDWRAPAPVPVAPLVFDRNASGDSARP